MLVPCAPSALPGRIEQLCKHPLHKLRGISWRNAVPRQSPFNMLPHQRGGGLAPHGRSNSRCTPSGFVGLKEPIEPPVAYPTRHGCRGDDKHKCFDRTIDGITERGAVFRSSTSNRRWARRCSRAVAVSASSSRATVSADCRFAHTWMSSARHPDCGRGSLLPVRRLSSRSLSRPRTGLVSRAGFRNSGSNKRPQSTLPRVTRTGH
jgi:hypothetical protein